MDQSEWQEVQNIKTRDWEHYSELQVLKQKSADIKYLLALLESQQEIIDMKQEDIIEILKKQNGVMTGVVCNPDIIIKDGAASIAGQPIKGEG